MMLAKDTDNRLVVPVNLIMAQAFRQWLAAFCFMCPYIDQTLFVVVRIVHKGTDE